VSATFTLLRFTLSVGRNGTGTGTVTSSPGGINCGATCSATFNFNQTVTLTATPASNSTFAGWSGGGCSGTGTCTTTITAAIGVTATFALRQFPLTVTINHPGQGHGTVTSNPAGINCTNSCAANFNINRTVTLTAVEDSGSFFRGWEGACTGFSATCTVTMTAAVGVTVTFEGPPR
jgi:hypothetical protein